MAKTVIFSGGGSGGHVVPALTLMEELTGKGVDVKFIGSKKGIESEIIPQAGHPYRAIHTGKFRRYFSPRNVLDLFFVFLGTIESLFFLLRENRKETLVFSTGGFVAVPVAMGAWLLRIPLYVHEQTTRVGLSNRIAARFADKIFISFESSREFFPPEKTFLSGYPIRKEFFQKDGGNSLVVGDVDISRSERPILFVTGGGNGARLLNEKVRGELGQLSSSYTVVHQVGKPFIDEYKKYHSSSYIPVAFLGREMVALMKRADLVVSRAGAGTVAELLALKKASLFVPLKIAQKNEQYHNAMEAHKEIGSLVIDEESFQQQKLSQLLKELEEKRQSREFVDEDEKDNRSSALDYLQEEILQAHK